MAKAAPGTLQQLLSSHRCLSTGNSIKVREVLVLFNFSEIIVFWSRVHGPLLASETHLEDPSEFGGFWVVRGAAKCNSETVFMAEHHFLLALPKPNGTANAIWMIFVSVVGSRPWTK